MTQSECQATLSSHDLHEQARELAARSDALLAEAAQLRRQAAEQEQIEHRERLRCDAEYRAAAAERAAGLRREASEELRDALPVPQIFDRSRRCWVPSPDSVHTDEGGYRMRVSRDVNGGVVISAVGPRGGHHGALAVAEQNLPALAGMAEDFISAYPGCCADEASLAVSCAVTDGSWMMSCRPSSRSWGIAFGKEGHLPWTISPRALSGLAGLLRRPVTTGLYDESFVR